MNRTSRLIFVGAVLVIGCGDNTMTNTSPDLTATPQADMAKAAADLSSSADLTNPPADMTVSGPTCAAYCTAITANCTAANIQYTDVATCNADCTKNYGWPTGMITDTSGDTLACRAYHTSLAAGSANNAMTHCPHAGPSGGNACGTWCDVYCDLALRNCTGNDVLFADKAACMTTCTAIPATGMPNDASGNTVQCRIFHLGLAGADAASATTHCPHGKVPSAACN